MPVFCAAFVLVTLIAGYRRLSSSAGDAVSASLSLAHLEAATCCSPSTPDALYGLGRRWMQLGNNAAARTAFARGLLEHPGSARLHLALGQAYRRDGSHFAAYQEAQFAVQLAPQEADGWKLLGSEACAVGDLTQAASALHRALLLRPDDWRAQIGEGAILMRLGRSAEGNACLREATRLAPQEPAAWQARIQYADTAEERGRLRAQWLAARNARAAPIPAASDGLPDAATAATLLADADWLRAQGRLEEAKRAYLAIAAQMPQSARAYAGAGLVCRDRGELEAAFALLKHAADLEPLSAEVQTLLGGWYLQAGFKKEAARRLEWAVKADRRSAACWHMLGQARSALDVQNEGAEDAYRRAVALEPRNPAYLLDLAEMLVVNNRLAEAQTLYRQAVALEPRNADACSRLGAFLLDHAPESAEEAGKLLGEAVQNNPSNEFAWYQFGRLAARRGQSEQATTAFERAVALAPQMSEGWYALARAHARAGRQEQQARAMQHFEQLRDRYQQRARVSELLDMRPQDAELHVRLARLYAASGENAKSLYEYAIYLRLRPADERAAHEQIDLQTRLKRSGHLPRMALFRAMTQDALRHSPARQSPSS